MGANNSHHLSAVQALRENRSLSHLHISGNPLGNSGASILGMLLRRREKSSTPRFIIKTLDISSCDISDEGFQEFISSNCILPQNLDLSCNKLTPSGVIELSHHFLRLDDTAMCFALDLSGNDVRDEGAISLAEAMIKVQKINPLGTALLRDVKLRCAGLKADGVAAFGPLVKQISDDLALDLSGNAIGIIDDKSRTKSLKTGVTKKTYEYVNFIGGKLKNVLGSSGLVNQNEEDSDQYDRDETEFPSKTSGEEMFLESEAGARNGAKKSRCGARAFADAVINSQTKGFESAGDGLENQKTFALGMRQCALDFKGAAALAAAIISSRKFNVRLTVDASMNSDLTQDVLAALSGEGHEDKLRSMAEMHMELLQKLENFKKESALRAERAMAQAKLSEASWAADQYDNVYTDYDRDDYDQNDYDQYDYDQEHSD